MNFIKIPGRAYEMMDAPVTQAEWRKVMGNNPSYFKGNSKRPVESVSWNDCQDFIKKLNEKNDGYTYDLPDGKEWEDCCRAGSTKDYCFGNSTKTLKNYAWFSENSKNHTQQVKKKKPNKWGLYDMHGNVYEWTSSVCSPNDSDRVIRGGSWHDDAQDLRSAYRGGDDPGGRYGDVGFRLVRTKVTPGSFTLEPLDKSKLLDAVAEIEAGVSKLKKMLEGE